MGKLQTYLYALKKSATEPSYYKDIIQTRFRFSLFFFLSTLVISTLFTSIALRLRVVPYIATTIQQESQMILNQLPDTIQFHFQNGTLRTSNISLPFLLHSSDSLTSQGVPKTLAVITADNTPSSQALFTITPQRAILKNENQTQDILYSDIWKDTQWNKTKIDLQHDRDNLVKNIPQFSTTVLLFLLPFIYVGILLSLLFLLLFLTIFTNTLAWAIGVRLPYLKTFQIGLHAIAIASLVDTLSKVVYPTMDFSLLIPAYIGISVLALFSLRKAPQP